MVKHNVTVNGKRFEVEVEQEPYTGKMLNRYPPAVPRAPVGAPGSGMPAEPVLRGGTSVRDTDDSGSVSR